MFIDVVFSPNEFASRDFKDKSVAVIDALRATTTIAYALWGYKKEKSSEISGCAKIIPVETVEEAYALAKSLPSAILTGERMCLKPKGFMMGNSPKDYTAEKIQGKTIVYTTTNGTRALKMAENAKFVTTAAFVNASKSVGALYKKQNDVIILCAGRSGKTTKEDSSCAGLIVKLLMQKCSENGIDYKLSDSADIALKYFEYYQNDLHSLLKGAEAGQNLLDVGLESDIADCLKIDLIDISTKFENNSIIIE